MQTHILLHCNTLRSNNNTATKLRILDNEEISDVTFTETPAEMEKNSTTIAMC